MKRYFFDLSDGSQERDLSGTEFPDDQTAQREAIRYAGEVLKHEPDRLSHGHMRVDVSDDVRSILFAIDVSLIAAGHR